MYPVCGRVQRRTRAPQSLRRYWPRAALSEDPGQRHRRLSSVPPTLEESPAFFRGFVKAVSRGGLLSSQRIGIRRFLTAEIYSKCDTILDELQNPSSSPVRVSCFGVHVRIRLQMKSNRIESIEIGGDMRGWLCEHSVPYSMIQFLELLKT